MTGLPPVPRVFQRAQRENRSLGMDERGGVCPGRHNQSQRSRFIEQNLWRPELDLLRSLHFPHELGERRAKHLCQHFQVRAAHGFRGSGGSMGACQPPMTVVSFLISKTGDVGETRQKPGYSRQCAPGKIFRSTEQWHSAPSAAPAALRDVCIKSTSIRSISETKDGACSGNRTWNRFAWSKATPWAKFNLYCAIIAMLTDRKNTPEFS